MGDVTAAPAKRARRATLVDALWVAAVVVVGAASRGVLWRGAFAPVTAWQFGALLAVVAFAAGWAARSRGALRALGAVLLAASVAVPTAWWLRSPPTQGSPWWLVAWLAGAATCWGLLRVTDRATPQVGPSRMVAVYAALGVAAMGIGRTPPPTLSATRVIERQRPRCAEHMVFLDGGRFTMGSQEGGEGTDVERPQHDVTMAPFCIGRTEVTVADYRACVTAGACEAPTAYDATPGQGLSLCNWGRPDTDGHPINCVTNTQATAFCAWQNPRGGALPSEDQWEFAARGREGRLYPWGNQPEPAPENTNLCGAECVGALERAGVPGGLGINGWEDPWPSTARVADLPRAGDTPEGLVGMAGNVWEWTRTPYGQYTAHAGSSTQYTGIQEITRVIRGGGWYDLDRSVARATYRCRGVASNWDSGVGFRCVAEGT